MVEQRASFIPSVPKSIIPAVHLTKPVDPGRTRVKYKRLCLRLTESEFNHLSEVAKVHKTTMSEATRLMLRDYYPLFKAMMKEDEGKRI